MTEYPLHPLLRLRNLREDKAVHALEVARRRQVQAEKELDGAKTAHQRFMDWLAREEERRYREIMETLMDLDEVDDFKQGLLILRAREAQYLEEILKAEQRVETAEKILVQAKADLMTAQKGTMRVEVHRDQWLKGVQKEAERLEEMEIEDFSASRNKAFNPGAEQEGLL